MRSARSWVASPFARGSAGPPPARVGAALALLGFLIWIVAWRDARTAPVAVASSGTLLRRDAPARAGAAAGAG